MVTLDTIWDYFLHNVDRRGERVAVHFCRQGQWQSLTWRQIAADVVCFAEQLRDAGVRNGDRVAHYSENRYEWIVTDLAIQALNAIHVPIHAPLSGAQAAYQIQHSGATVAIVSNDALAGRLAAAAAALPETLQVRSYDPLTSNLPGSVHLLHRAADGAAPRDVPRPDLDPTSTTTILYTSGTTGEPKGVMLSPSNLVSNALAAQQQFGQADDDLRVSFLPFSHIFARTCDLYIWIASGTELAVAQSRETVLADCAAIRPTLLCGVPYFYDKVARHLVAARQTSPEALRQILGGRIRSCCSGGAALADHVFDFFAERGLPILQGYGLTETSPVISASSQEQFRRGSSGPPIPGVEVRIADDGEILTRGPHVMLGYYRNQAATDEMIRDGWLYTGDLGRLEDGFLYITGRKKEILVTSGGKNIAPVALEAMLTKDPLILQALVVGDGRDYLAALIVPNPDLLGEQIVQLQIPVQSPAEALVHPRVLELYRQHIDDCLRDVSYYEQVRRFVLLPRGFTIDSGEMTPKLSLRRKQIEANFADQIAQLYDRSKAR